MKSQGKSPVSWFFLRLRIFRKVVSSNTGKSNGYNSISVLAGMKLRSSDDKPESSGSSGEEIL